MKKDLVNDPQVLGMFDAYVHGLISRRQFLDQAASFSATGLSAAALLELLSPNYALAQQVSPDDPSIVVGYREYDSPQGGGNMRGYLAMPANAEGELPGVVVIHENRGLNPYIEDVARRTAVAGFVAFAPDALTPLGGYPGNDDEGRALQQQRDRNEMLNDFIAAVRYLQRHEACSGKVGCVGFCFGGWMANALAVNVADLGAAVAFYGGQPEAADVARINAPLLIHHGGLDERVNAGWPAYRVALEASGKRFIEYTYEGCNHGFHNDTTPRYDQAAAELAWQRTIEFFRQNLV
ncbi:MAG: dienelactone hydrolase family protein [Gammaproteobacteria bacterium]|nr:dienelactone hydrolase family protein [Gammaproteobacteria bacterium]MDH4315290.1 dienelactone hydrolase family protein [Gammaproteobacteria bacterium]MDH5213944.1 dienelactone hydrolase family protein [Gammaproteobacteria bacterium]MDH5499590.1 dienelactone hydrolase family protein [Gammaproteobacteria bacterium]